MEKTSLRLRDYKVRETARETGRETGKGTGWGDK